MSKLESDLYSKLKEKEETFLSFNLDFFLAFEKLPCDLYIELKKGVYKKIAHREDKLSSLDLKVVSNRSIENLFVNTEEYFFGQNEFKLESLVEISDDEERELYFNIYKDSISDLGFSKKALEKTLSNINLILEDKNDSFNHLVSQFNTRKGSYLYNHSILISVLALSFTQQFDWYSSKIEKKIIISSCLHDLGFSKDSHVIFETSNEKILDNLIYFIRDDIDQHAEKITDQLSDLKNIDSDIINMIKYHHFTTDEISRLPETSYSNIVYIFRLCHELATGLMKVSFNSKKYAALIDEIVKNLSLPRLKNISNDFTKYFKEILTNEKI